MTDTQVANDGAPPHWSFASIYGGNYDSEAFAGKLVLVVNTASLCGYTPQFAALQKLQDAYKDQGLIVLAVPSDDFDQEKDDNAAVKDFCERTYDITLPMTVISAIKGPDAHPLFQWLEAEAGFVPDWNFNKVLLDRQGRVSATWRSEPEPLGGEIESAIQQALQS